MFLKGFKYVLIFSHALVVVEFLSIFQLFTKLGYTTYLGLMLTLGGQKQAACPHRLNGSVSATS